MSRKNNPTPHRPMSIDAMLDMERQEVLALLENKGSLSTSPERTRAESPYAPRSPVRSMIDIPEEDDSDIAGGESGARKNSAPARVPVRSMLDVDTPSSPRAPIRSMLDTDAPVPALAKHQSSSSALPRRPLSPAEISPKSLSPGQAPHPRSKSDAGQRPAEFGPRFHGGRNDPTSDYQFSGILSHGNTQKMPKRVAQGGKRASGGSLGDALRGVDFSGLQMPTDRGRHSSIGPRLGNKSKSPHDRPSNRSQSPATFRSLATAPVRPPLDDNETEDFSNAYRRLSDANLAFSSGSLSQLPRKKSEDVGEGRLVKDYLGPDGEHLGSSEEEDEPFSSDDEDRGRKKAPRPLNLDVKGERSPRSGRRKSLSLMAAAEEERSQVASTQPKYQYRSLIPEPEIQITNTSGKTTKPAKNVVHPHTSFDHNPESANPSVIDSDEEADMDDIKRAQKLSFSMTNILSSAEAHRAIRIIYRGEYHKIAQAAEDHGLRKYLVATDLSDESTHALEWAVGTVLRDGDTLIAIYCVDEETGIVTSEGALVPDDPKAMKEQAAVINSVTNTKLALAPTTAAAEFRRPSAFNFLGEAISTPGSSPAPTGRDHRGRASEERRRAVQGITDRVLRLLRKTNLQVRVVVEVLHCKNPKHLITEVIDLVNPTLVVIGSRGRSALKGVILGSFSNYLVTKSSVPVMVARKRLRKASKYKRTAVRQVNNLSNPTVRSLANAKVD